MKIPLIAKFAIKMVVMAGVNQVLTNIIKVNTPLDITKAQQIFTNIGRIAISDCIAGAVADQVVKDVEEIFEAATFGPSKEETKWPICSDFKHEDWEYTEAKTPIKVHSDSDRLIGFSREVSKVINKETGETEEINIIVEKSPGFLTEILKKKAEEVNGRT